MIDGGANKCLAADQQIDQLRGGRHDDRLLRAPFVHEVDAEQFLQDVHLVERGAGCGVLDDQLAAFELGLQHVDPRLGRLVGRQDVLVIRHDDADDAGVGPQVAAMRGGRIHRKLRRMIGQQLSLARHCQIGREVGDVQDIEAEVAGIHFGVDSCQHPACRRRVVSAYDVEERVLRLEGVHELREAGGGRRGREAQRALLPGAFDDSVAFLRAEPCGRQRQSGPEQPRHQVPSP